MYEMKESGIKWIGQIPKHWEVRKVKHIGKLISGVGFPISYQGFYEYEIPFYKVNSLSTSEKYIEIKTDTISESMVVSLGAKKIQPNSILFAKVGAALLLNRFRINKYQCCIDNNMSSLSLHKHSILEYIYFAFSLFDFKYIVNNGAIPSINETQIYSVKFPFPPLDEQKKIADFLDKKVSEIENLIDDTKKLIEKYREYKQSIITETVTKGLNSNVEMKESGIEWIGQIPKHWILQKIKFIGNIRNGVTYHPENMVDENNGILVLRSSNIKDGELVYNDNVYINLYVKNSLLVKQGNILVCARNGSKDLVGKNAIINANMHATFGAFMLLLNIKHNIFPKYIYYILNSCVFDYYLGSFLTTTINQLTNRNFNNMHIVYCKDYDEQEEIVKYLDDKCSQIDNIIEEKQLLLEKLEAYKKSLIYEYVTGKKQVGNE